MSKRTYSIPQQVVHSMPGATKNWFRTYAESVEKNAMSVFQNVFAEANEREREQLDLAQKIRELPPEETRPMLEAIVHWSPRSEELLWMMWHLRNCGPQPGLDQDAALRKYKQLLKDEIQNNGPLKRVPSTANYPVAKLSKTLRVGDAVYMRPDGSVDADDRGNALLGVVRWCRVGGSSQPSVSIHPGETGVVCVESRIP